jgi:AcrR family transcriptional regulator
MSPSSQRVLDVALRMFANESYDAVSVRRLANALGIQAPSIYSHFASKSDLLQAIIGRFADRIDGILDAAPAAPVSSAARRAWLNDYLALMSEEAPAVKLSSLDPAVLQHPVLGPRLWDQMDRLTALLRRFGVVDDRVATAIVGSICHPLYRLASVTDTHRLDDIDLLIRSA